MPAMNVKIKKIIIIKPADGRLTKSTQNLTNDFGENYMMFIEKSTRISEPGNFQERKI